MRHNGFLTGLGLTATLFGCGGVSGIPIEKTAKDFAKAICPKAYDCCTTEQLMGNKDLAGTTEAECEANTTQNFRERLNMLQASENAGRSKFDQAAVDGCLTALRAATCSDLTMIRSLAGLPACNSTFETPLVALGGTCGQDYECIDSVCQKAPGEWEGVCAAGVATGASCVTNHCAPDLSCDPRDGNVEGDEVCVAEQENGAACNDNYECKSRYCVAPSDATAKTCMAVPTPQCFYGGGCAAAGGAPRLASLLVMGLFVAVALLRARRRARSHRGARSR
jgi:hypothetical protein